MTSTIHDFDFIFGRWAVHNEKLVDALDLDCDEWVHFEATDVASPILEGAGHVHRMYVPEMPGGKPFEGFTLRLFDPVTSLWRIWWSSTRAPGVLVAPLVGHFTDGHGVFESDEVIGGAPVKVRFEWLVSLDAPRWQQSFSFDDGASWRRNWLMKFERTSGDASV